MIYPMKRIFLTLLALGVILPSPARGQNGTINKTWQPFILMPFGAPNITATFSPYDGSIGTVSGGRCGTRQALFRIIEERQENGKAVLTFQVIVSAATLGQCQLGVPQIGGLDSIQVDPRQLGEITITK